MRSRIGQNSHPNKFLAHFHLFYLQMLKKYSKATYNSGISIGEGVLPINFTKNPFIIRYTESLQFPACIVQFPSVSELFPLFYRLLEVDISKKGLK